jgi:arylsulfatase
MERNKHLFSGTSFVFSFDDASAKDRHTTQYFEMFGNRAIYQDGWVASTRHSIPWIITKNPPLSEDVWELYNVNEDFTEAHDLAASNPDKLKQLQKVFEEEAIKNHVFPIDDRRSERFDPAVAGRPDLMGTRTVLNLYEGMNLAEAAFINIKTRSYSITAEVDVPANANGVIISQAGRFGGWTLYTKAGKVNYEYNFFGLESSRISSPKPLSAGKHTLKYDFVITEAKPGSGGACILYVDGSKVAEGSIPKTQPFTYSADEGVSVGSDPETNVSKEYNEGDNHFTGKIIKVVVDTTPK